MANDHKEGLMGETEGFSSPGKWREDHQMGAAWLSIFNSPPGGLFSLWLPVFHTLWLSFSFAPPLVAYY